jgi:hypothetical protein
MCCLLTWISDPQKRKKRKAKQSWVCIHSPFWCHQFSIILNQIVCKEPPNAQPNLPTNASTVSDRNNCEMFFLLGPMLNLSSWSSWISDFQRKKLFVRDHSAITHVQFGFNQISSFWDELLFFICPAAVAILDLRWTKTKLFKRVKYDIFLQNNMFIPRVVSDMILKLRHQKELVVEAMLNFWIKWKTCNVGNHPCNISTMLGLWLVKNSFKCLWAKMNATWWQ